MTTLLIKNIGLLQTPTGSYSHRGKEQGKNLKLRDAAILIGDGMISEITCDGRLPGRHDGRPAADAAAPHYSDWVSSSAAEPNQVIDADGALVTPGLVDGHTHMVFGGYRQHEIPLKLRGAGYLDILRAGGGIMDTVRKTREAAFDELCIKTQGFLDQMMSLGVTSCEAKSGYGLDKDNKHAFAELLEKVAKTGIDRIRFTTPYPSDFNAQVFDVMAKYDNIMPSLHLPMQSGSDAILKRMNRRYTRAEFLDIVKLLRAKIPDVFLTTDIIVAFPGETEEDFQKTLSLVEECQFDGAFTFLFSPRPGTPASRMEDKTSAKEKHDRFDRLKNLVDKLSTKSARKMVGTRVKVLFEEVSKKDESMISGYDEHGKLVHVKGDKDLLGRIEEVDILESHTYSLIGKIHGQG